MKSKSGLRAVKKSVHGKRGTVTRTYWVKASPKAEAQKGNRQISAGEMLKRHGLQIAGRGAAHGAGTYAVQREGMRVGMKVGDFTGRKQIPRVRDLHESVGGLTGLAVGSAAAVVGGRKFAYAGKRGAAIRADYQRATIGGKAVAAGLHAVSLAAGWQSVSSAHAAQIRWSGKREAAAANERFRAKYAAYAKAQNWGSEF